MSKHKQPYKAGKPEPGRGNGNRIILVVVLVAVVALVGAGIGVQLWRSRKAPQAADGALTLQQLNTEQAPVTGEPLVLGRSTAPVTVTLYEDFHCPHCAEFEDTFGDTLTKAEGSGSVKIELYPMSFIDAGSKRAANGMACAAAAGFPQTYYLGLFANHTLEWNSDQLIKLAGVTGSTATDTFTSCVKNQTYNGWADSINATATKNNVSSTPTMFLNGRPVDVATLTPEALTSQINEAST